MKHFRLIQFVMTFMISAGIVQFASASNDNKEVIIIESSRFAAPLVEKWANEYEKYNPNIEIIFTEGDQLSEVDLSLVSSTYIDSSDSNENKFTHTARFALLPVTNSENPFLNELSRKRLNNKTIRELFLIAISLTTMTIHQKHLNMILLSIPEITQTPLQKRLPLTSGI